MNGTRHAFIWMVILVLGTGSVQAQEKDWPRTVAVEQGTVTLYEPQVEEMDDGFLAFRSALAWRPEAGADPVFGIGWFEADVVTNRFAGTVHPVELRISQVRFPADAPDVRGLLTTALARPGAAADFNFSLAALEDSLAGTQAERQEARQLNTKPPKIIYRDRPALLVTLDGAPILREIENSPLEAVINTPFPLIHDGRHYWLNVADGAWYRSGKATGPYAFGQAWQQPEDRRRIAPRGGRFAGRQADLARRVAHDGGQRLRHGRPAAEVDVDPVRLIEMGLDGGTRGSQDVGGHGRGRAVGAVHVQAQVGADGACHGQAVPHVVVEVSA